MGAVLLGLEPASAQTEQQQPSKIEGPVSRKPVPPQIQTLDLRTIAERYPAPLWRPGDPVTVVEDLKERIKSQEGEPKKGEDSGRLQTQTVGEETDTQLQSVEPPPQQPSSVSSGAITDQPTAGAAAPSTAAPPPVQVSFDGIPATGMIPPDTNGAVGPNHYIQMVNTAFAVYDKSGNILAGPLPINALWAGFGGACEKQNNGDPIVRYDHLADRWLLSQFALPGPDLHECIAISRTPDPVAGGWYLYDFPTIDTSSGNFVFPDYPKIGVWPDAYYMGTQRTFPTGGLDVWAFERQQMLNGAAAGMVQFHVTRPSLFLLPSDLDGPPPPAGAPNTFARQIDGERFGGQDRIELFEFHVDWANPANSSFTQVATLPTDPFDTVLCQATLIGRCIPQPGTDVRLESLTVWAMWRLQYRNFGDHESLVFNHTIDENGQDHAGIRWYELRRSGGPGWTISQQGNHAPDAVHRWMGSAAMDGAGNLAVGYSVSSERVFPGIRYAMRVPGDPPGTLAQGEGTIIDGGGSQTHGSSRWGNYSALDVDPVDDCTFWYTTEYYPTTSSAGWRTRIASFKHPDCSQPEKRQAFKYAAKILCGIQEDPDNLRLARGLYATAINIFNPNEKEAELTKKLALTYPPEAQAPGKVHNISTDILGPDQALEVDCEDLKRNVFPNGFPAPYIKGFVVIKSSHSLDVTAVYTTRSLDGPCCPEDQRDCCRGEHGCCDKKEHCCPSGGDGGGGRGPVVGPHSSIDVEQIRERVIEDVNDEEELPDLIPVPKADPPYPPEAFCRIRDNGILITVRNQGEAQADPSITEVLFTAVNQSVLRPTPELEPDEETDLHFAFPPGGCTGGGEQCPFRITVDQSSALTESNEANNVAEGGCVFLL